MLSAGARHHSQVMGAGFHLLQGMTMTADPAMHLMPAFAAYLRKVQCHYCGTNVYACESDARNEAEYQITCCGARDIDDLKGSLNRICAGCEYFLNKDD